MCARLGNDSMEHSGNPILRSAGIALKGTITPGYHERLQTILSKQERLAKAREKLLLQRENLRAAAAQIREKRNACGDAEADLMNALRALENENFREPSMELKKLYSRVEVARTELGALEADYILAEKDLVGAEWRFMVQENEFYQFDIEEFLEQQTVSTASVPLHIPLLHTLPPPPTGPPLFLGPATQLPFANISFPPVPPRPPASPPPAEFAREKPPSSTEVQTHRDVPIYSLGTADGLGPGFELESTSPIEEELQLRDIEWFAELLPTDFASRKVSTQEAILEYEKKSSRTQDKSLQYESQIDTSAPPYFESRYPSVQRRVDYFRNTLPKLSEQIPFDVRVQHWLLMDLKENVVNQQLYLSVLHSHDIDTDSMSLQDWTSEYWELDATDAGEKDELEHTQNRSPSQDEQESTTDSASESAVETCQFVPERQHSEFSKVGTEVQTQSNDFHNTGLSAFFQQSTRPRQANHEENAFDIFESPPITTEFSNAEVTFDPSNAKVTFLESKLEPIPSPRRDSHQTPPEPLQRKSDAGEWYKADVMPESGLEKHVNIPRIELTMPQGDCKQIFPITFDEKISIDSPCEHAWFHCIRVNAITIPRPLSIHEEYIHKEYIHEEYRSKRSRISGFVKGHKRSRSTSAAFSPHNPGYTPEVRERDLRLGGFFQAL
ncbi:hypothetical protein IQ07DRAFT_586112 [Pyrenochaeta sp. DS3sAY3a]|nr:hypothetical protein IQ07DRAFT_586112 [Pyrenochaeta sp. DS3sAY3a]